MRDDLYSVLQIAPDANDSEIKSAFRHLAKTYHPDIKPGDREAEAAFQEVRRAYQFLSNPETRKLYDTFLANRRAVERARWRRAAATMSATFLLTAATVFLVAAWLHQEGIPVGRLVAGAIERSTMELARAPGRGEPGDADSADSLPAGQSASSAAPAQP